MNTRYQAGRGLSVFRNTIRSERFGRGFQIAICALGLGLALSTATPKGATAAGKSMIEIGGGAAFGGQSPLEAVFRVDFALTNGGRHTSLVVAKISGDAMIGVSGNSFIDLEFETIGIQGGSKDDYARLSFITGDIQRNLQINNELSARITLVGVRGSKTFETEDENTVIYLKGAIDLLGIGIAKRASDQIQNSGAAAGAAAEIGVKFFDHIRISLGEKLSATSWTSISREIGYTCDRYYDDWGNDYSTCSSDYETRQANDSITSSTYLSLVMDLTETLSLFGKASYNVFAFNDQTGVGGYTSNSAFQFFLGVSKRF